MKKLFDKIKAFIDVWKIWLFFGALIGTNAGQQIYYSEPVIEKPAIAKTIEKRAPETKKTIIIHKVDTKLVKKLIKQELQKHFDSSRH